MKRSLMLMSVRALGLGARFALSLYLAHYLGLKEVGTFGLVTAVAGFAPAVIGLGLNYFMSRDVVGMSTHAAAVILRDRLVITVITLCVVGMMIAPIIWGRESTYFFLIAIVFLECVSFDIHMWLLARERAGLAQTALFLRGSAWSFVAIGMGIIWPQTRSLWFVWVLWICGYMASMLLLLAKTTRASVWPVMRQPVDWSWIQERMRHAKLIYLNDNCIASMMFSDRFIIEHFLNRTATGVFTFYWTLANGIYVLISTGLVQVTTPQLVAAVKRQDQKAWLSLLHRRGLLICAAAVFLSVVADQLMTRVMPLLNILGPDPWFFRIMLVGTWVRLLADYSNTALFSQKADRTFAVTNLIGAGLALVCGSLGVYAFGLRGIGLSLLGVPIVLFAMRYFILSRMIQSHNQNT